MMAAPPVPGCQIHDHDGWRKALERTGNPPGRITAVIPLVAQTNGQTLLFGPSSFKTLPAIGLPRIEDTSGRVWFIDAPRHVLTALEPSGIRRELEDDGIFSGSTLVQEKDGTYWLLTTRGLLHLTLTAQGHIQPIGPYYSRGIPTHDVLNLFTDPDRNLWLVT